MDTYLRSMGNGVQFMTKYEQLQHREQNRLESNGGANGAPDMTVINMDRGAAAAAGDEGAIPMETRQRTGSTAVSLKMHDEDEDDLQAVLEHVVANDSGKN